MHVQNPVWSKRRAQRSPMKVKCQSPSLWQTKRTRQRQKQCKQLFSQRWRGRFVQESVCSRVCTCVCVCVRKRECLFVCVSRSVMDEEGTRLSPSPPPPNEVYRCLFVIAISGAELSPQDQAPIYLCLTKQDGTTKTTQNIIQPLNRLFFVVIVQCQSQRKLDGKSAN